MDLNETRLTVENTVLVDDEEEYSDAAHGWVGGCVCECRKASPEFHYYDVQWNNEATKQFNRPLNGSTVRWPKYSPQMIMMMMTTMMPWLTFANQKIQINLLPNVIQRQNDCFTIRRVYNNFFLNNCLFHT